MITMELRAPGVGWGCEGSRAVFAVEEDKTGLSDSQGLAGQGAGSRPERVRAAGEASANRGLRPDRSRGLGLRGRPQQEGWTCRQRSKKPPKPFKQGSDVIGLAVCLGRSPPVNEQIWWLSW